MTDRSSETGARQAADNANARADTAYHNRRRVEENEKTREIGRGRELEEAAHKAKMDAIKSGGSAGYSTASNHSRVERKINWETDGDDSLIKRGVKSVYDEEKGGMQWASVIGGLALGGAGMMMGNYIAGAAGFSGTWMGVVAMAVLALSGAAFGSKLANDFFPPKNTSTKPTSTDTTSSSPDRPKGIALEPDGRTLNLKKSDNSYALVARENADFTLEVDSNTKGEFTATSAIVKANGQDLRIVFDAPIIVEPFNLNTGSLTRISNMVNLTRNAAQGETPEAKQITPDEQKNFNFKVQNVEQYNGAVAPPASTPAPPPLPSPIQK